MSNDTTALPPENAALKALNAEINATSTAALLRRGVVPYRLWLRDLDDSELDIEIDHVRRLLEEAAAGAFAKAGTTECLELQAKDCLREHQRRQRLQLPAWNRPHRLDRATVDDIRRRTDLVRLVEGSGVELRRSGPGGYRGRCPWCQSGNATTLSVVTSQPERWHCFKCGEGGDAISWQQLDARQSFDEAVRALAAMAGVGLAMNGATR